MNVWKNVWMTVWMDICMSEWMNELVTDSVYEWMRMNEWINYWMNEWLNECMNEWMNVWVRGWMNVWLSGCMHVCMDAVCIDGWMNASRRSRTEEIGNVCAQSARRANPTYGSVDSACAIKHNTYQARVISAMCWFCVCKWVWLNAFTVPRRITFWRCGNWNLIGEHTPNLHPPGSPI